MLGQEATLGELWCSKLWIPWECGDGVESERQCLNQPRLSHKESILEMSKHSVSYHRQVCTNATLKQGVSNLSKLRLGLRHMFHIVIPPHTHTFPTTTLHFALHGVLAFSTLFASLALPLPSSAFLVEAH